MITSLHAALGALLDEGFPPPGSATPSVAPLCRTASRSWASTVGRGGHRLPQLTTVVVPAGVDDAAVRAPCSAAMASRSAAEWGPWAGKIWRIGCMGHTARPRNVTLLLAALAETAGSVTVRQSGSGWPELTGPARSCSRPLWP